MAYDPNLPQWVNFDDDNNDDESAQTMGQNIGTLGNAFKKAF